MGKIRLNTPVRAVARFDNRVEVTNAFGDTETFDEIIFACHSDQALAMLTDAMPAERELLAAFPYEPNTAVLHKDISVLPKRKRVWTAWNYRLRKSNSGKASVTYNMNILQHIDSDNVFCVTLNDTGGIDEQKVLRRIPYAHPIFTPRRSGRYNKLVAIEMIEAVGHRECRFARDLRRGLLSA